MFRIFKRRAAMTDFWSVFNNHAQIGDPAALVGWVEARTRREAMRKARVLRPHLSVFIDRVSKAEAAEVEARLGKPVDFRRLLAMQS